MIQRTVEPLLKELSTQFLTVTIQGPRQSGKTTLTRMAFPNYNYVNLEDPRALELAQHDVDAFFERYPSPLIIDEVQLYPKLLRKIQILVDEHQQMGEFILTGSHQPLLREGIAESLAGRTTILELLPLSLEELRRANIALSREEYLFNGFMPRVYQQETPPTRLYQSYYQTYVERDVRKLINVRDEDAFRTFMILLAGRVGQLVNLNSLSNEIGVSVPTLRQWLSVLEASYVVFTLHPYAANVSRRLTKTPKIYFTEPGLAAYLLGLTEPAQIVRDPIFGGLFENMVILEALKAHYNYGLLPQLSFYRDARGLEVDLLLRIGLQLRAFEIKSAFAPNPIFTNALEQLETVLKAPLQKHAVIYAGEDCRIGDTPFINYQKAAQCFGR